MSLSPSVPHVLDNFGSFQPMALFDPTREDLTSLHADRYEEDESAVRFLIEAPSGLMPQETRVAVQNGQLYVSGARHTVSEDGTTESQEQFQKTISLNDQALQLNKMDAKLYGHTLIVGIPKKKDT